MKIYALTYDVHYIAKSFHGLCCECFGSKREAIARYRELSAVKEEDDIQVAEADGSQPIVNIYEKFSLSKCDVPTDKKGLLKWLTEARLQEPDGHRETLPHAGGE
tara:strand:- start:10267 stop:10581 length:315 start_codon:yes stop_codon:yes gene_type:complete